MVAVALALMLVGGRAPGAEPAGVREELRRALTELYSGAPEEALARFDRLAREHPERPEGPLFAAFGRLLQLEEDPFHEVLRRDFRDRIELALRQAEEACARADRPAAETAQACLALGLAQGVRARFHVLDGAELRAASDARAARKALERALKLDPEEPNAPFGLGLYNYYAARLPRFARLLRLLLFFPGGNRERGLAQLESVRRRGDLLAPEAHLQLFDIYKYFEKDYQRALATIEDLIRSYPENPRFYLLKANLEGHFMGRGQPALETASLVERRVAAGEPHFGPDEALWARYVRATVDFRLGERQRAREELERLLVEPCAAPLWKPTVATTAALYAELSGERDPKLYQRAAVALGRADLLRILETPLRSVLPPEGYRRLRTFRRDFGQYLQSDGT